jgi:RNA polymerase II subunit A-like phosphatase
MKIRSPQHLRYPITVVDLLRKENEDIKRSAPLFSYYYETTVTERDEFGEPKEVKKRFPERFNSTTAGVITEWHIKNGTIIRRPGYVASRSVEVDS